MNSSWCHDFLCSPVRYTNRESWLLTEKATHDLVCNRKLGYMKKWLSRLLVAIANHGMNSLDATSTFNYELWYFLHQQVEPLWRRLMNYDTSYTNKQNFYEGDLWIMILPTPTSRTSMKETYELWYFLHQQAELLWRRLMNYDTSYTPTSRTPMKETILQFHQSLM